MSLPNQFCACTWLPFGSSFPLPIGQPSGVNEWRAGGRRLALGLGPAQAGDSQLLNLETRKRAGALARKASQITTTGLSRRGRRGRSSKWLRAWLASKRQRRSARLCLCVARQSASPSCSSWPPPVGLGSRRHCAISGGEPTRR